MKKIFSIIPFALVLVSCWHVSVDMSKMPKNAIYCNTKYDCPDGDYCGFPAPNTYACCLPLSNDGIKEQEASKTNKH